MFDNLTIRSKLVALLAGPLAIIVVLAGLGAQDRRTTASSGRRAERIILLSRANSDAMNAIQTEDLYSAGYVASGRTEWKRELDQARSKTDTAVNQATDSFSALQGQLPAQVQVAGRLGLDAVSKLGVERSAIDAGYSWNQAVAALTSTEHTFLATNTRLADEIQDPQLSGQLRTIDALNDYKSSIAEHGALLVGAARLGRFDVAAAFDQLRSAESAQQLKQAIFRSLADSVSKGDLRNTLATSQASHLDAAGAAVDKGGPAAPVLASASDVVGWTRTVLGGLQGIETRIDVDLLNSAAAQSAAAAKAANLYLTAAGLGILLAAGASIVFGRRITQPLQRLTRAAEQLSDEQMPRLVEALRNPAEEDVAYLVSSMTPIEVGSQDELGALASAFNKVQKVAADVATEQAALLRKGIGEMFVNLARRNQTLLDRQIEFIDELESQEEDPDQLENLFKLDHLATRMRRNAESLLVLAGAEPARKRGRPAPLADVVRAALGEVEEFARIDLLSFDEVSVASNAAMDVAHLLSELMENATNFSPPETRVEVVGHRTKAEGYVLSVTDQGIGMSTAQITEFNQLLAHPPLVGLALTRSLGFIVIGRLAARFDITVRLMPSTGGGVTAVVSLPPGLITEAVPALAASLVAPPRLEAPPTARTTPAAAPSLVPPLELTPFDGPGPDSYDGAVPAGAAFDAGLAALMDEPSSPPSGSAPERPSGGADEPASRPGSRASATPSSPLDTGPAPSGRPSGPAPSPGSDGTRTSTGLPARRREAPASPASAAAPTSAATSAAGATAAGPAAPGSAPSANRPAPAAAGASGPSPTRVAPTTHDPIVAPLTARPTGGAGGSPSGPVHAPLGRTGTFDPAAPAARGPAPDGPGTAPGAPPLARRGSPAPATATGAPSGAPRLDGPPPRIDGAAPLFGTGRPAARSDAPVVPVPRLPASAERPASASPASAASNGAPTTSVPAAAADAPAASASAVDATAVPTARAAAASVTAPGVAAPAASAPVDGAPVVGAPSARATSSAGPSGTPPSTDDTGSSRPFFLHEGAEPPPVQLFGGSAAAPFDPADYEPTVATVTNSGLTRRVPRKDGATRAIPGADTDRGAGATKRSPDEVRSLLSSYRAGTERARSEDPAGAPAPDERDPQ